MKVTVMNAEPGDIARVSMLVHRYQIAGYADGSRRFQRNCVVYTRDNWSAAAVWGGPEHIRISFAKELQHGRD